MTADMPGLMHATRMRARQLRRSLHAGTVKAVRMANVQFVELAARMKRNPARRHSASFQDNAAVAAAAAR
jgi:uridylate kinase